MFIIRIFVILIVNCCIFCISMDLGGMYVNILITICAYYLSFILLLRYFIEPHHYGFYELECCIICRSSHVTTVLLFAVRHQQINQLLIIASKCCHYYSSHYIAFGSQYNVFFFFLFIKSITRSYCISANNLVFSVLLI